MSLSKTKIKKMKNEELVNLVLSQQKKVEEYSSTVTAYEHLTEKYNKISDVIDYIQYLISKLLVDIKMPKVKSNGKPRLNIFWWLSNGKALIDFLLKLVDLLINGVPAEYIQPLLPKSYGTSPNNYKVVQLPKEFVEKAKLYKNAV